ncbi:germination lipoprotein GerS-related protein [Clostridium sp.]|uniref:germination lipoprotein GerS-related protein n=1 Tax=Clostridium sp. TaxID=1506 RepID=UPI00283E4EF4|nr:germination lipoprotein GerS-related protein [Clostridium sp.]MDR3593325.1 germination lipoprotein GerS-related protein [Clostridium sp.]
MNLKNNLFNKPIIIGVLVLIPILVIGLVIICRNVIIPSNEDIINELRNTKCYSSKVHYVFKNSKSLFEENTIQYYSSDKGSRIEFLDDYKRVKVYKGGEIKVEGNEDEEYVLDKDIDRIYPLAFIQNILSNPQVGETQEVKEEWGQEVYLKVDVEYNINKHLNKAEFYIDKNKGVPVLLKIFDDNDKERIIITYNDFKKEKALSDELF